MIPKKYTPSNLALQKAIAKNLNPDSLEAQIAMFVFDIKHKNYIPNLWEVGKFVKATNYYPHGYDESMMIEKCPHTGTIFNYLEGTATASGYIK